MIELTIALFLLLIIAELFFSFVFISSQYGYNYYLLKKKFMLYQYNALTGYRMRSHLKYSNPRHSFPNAPRKKEFVNVRTDANGFVFTDDIDRLVQEKRKLIFCLGGSTTAGLECDYRKTFPSQLNALLQSSEYRCINAGLGAGRSIHELLVFKHMVLKYRPAAIILFSGYNDYECYAYKVYAPKNPYIYLMSHMLPKNKIESFLSYSCLYFLIKKRFMPKITVNANDVKRFQEVLDHPVWLEEWKSNLREIIHLCHENQIKCFLISSMSPVYKGASLEAKQFADIDLDMNGRFDTWVQYLDLIHEASRRLCQKEGAQFLDVEPFLEKYLAQFDQAAYFKERFSLFVDRFHFSEKGNEVLAQAIYEQLKGKLL